LGKAEAYLRVTRDAPIKSQGCPGVAPEAATHNSTLHPSADARQSDVRQDTIALHLPIPGKPIRPSKESPSPTGYAGRRLRTATAGDGTCRSA